MAVCSLAGRWRAGVAFALVAGLAPAAIGLVWPAVAAPDPHRLFEPSEQCMACHNGLTTPSGEDVSIGKSWRATMMANSARDPYWQAGVRREILDHPGAAAAIQDECATCHMPMARTTSRMEGKQGAVFQYLPVRNHGGTDDRLAHDGVSCALCHQIADRNLGTPASFTGGYVIEPPSAGPREMFGPFQIEKGLSTVMRSATGFQPTEKPHIRQSELCATCHTLITKALGPKGEVIGELPEQVPFLEWRHSAYVAEERSCQSCHMPGVKEETPIASVLGTPRKGFARHTFVGGNFFLIRMFGRYRDELGIAAQPDELEAAARETIRSLQNDTATVAIERVDRTDGRLTIDVAVRNLTGHKLPTGYPSRRAWLHATVRDRSGRVVFESGAVAPNGSIQGNDNDSDPLRFEPHYTEVRQSDQVQIYESVMRNAAGQPTTGLLTAIGYLKDNRLLPKGFSKTTADPQIAVVGGASQDGDFSEGGDRVRYVVDVSRTEGPLELSVELRFQVVSFRWANNLRAYKSEETARFVGYYDSMASSSSEVLSSQSTSAR